MPPPRARKWERSLVALLLALIASGAGSVALGGLPQPVHRCHCRHGPDEDCGCPGCRRALRKVAEDGSLPPCHRAAAKARLARAARHPERSCLRGSCGRDDERSPQAPRHDPVVLSRAPTLPHFPGPRPVPSTADGAGRMADAPPRPPPRAS